MHYTNHYTTRMHQNRSHGLRRLNECRVASELPRIATPSRVRFPGGARVFPSLWRLRGSCSRSQWGVQPGVGAAVGNKIEYNMICAGASVLRRIIEYYPTWG